MGNFSYSARITFPEMVINSTYRSLRKHPEIPDWEYESPAKFLPYFFFEKWDFSMWRVWLSQNWKFPFYASAFYIVVIYFLQNYMKRRKAFEVRIPLIIWNLVLSIFSILGTVRMLPEMISILTQSPDGFFNSVCNRDGLNAPAAIWGILFVLSKVVEMGDTLFICLRKQPLIFLHWYHHCASLILSWTLIPLGEPILRYYSLMNFFIHSIMYLYFLGKVMKIRISRKFSMVLTSLQVLQMFVAVGLNFYTFYVIYWLQVPCVRETGSFKWSFAVYGSFTFLFADFMYKAYFNQKTKKM